MNPIIIYKVNIINFLINIINYYLYKNKYKYLI